MIRDYWESLSVPLKMIFGVTAWVFLFILVHGTYTYRVNHQRAFAKAVETRIGIATVRVRAKSDVMIYEGSATPEQSAYAERIGQDFIQRYGPSAVNPPTEIRNSLVIRSPRQTRPAKLTFNRQPVKTSKVAAKAATRMYPRTTTTAATKIPTKVAWNSPTFQRDARRR